MKRIIPILILSVSLTACASRTTRVNTVMDSWLNHNIEERIANYGPPSSVFDLPSGNRIYSWDYVGNTRTVYFPVGNTVMGKSNAPTCQVNLTTDTTGKIIAYLWKGNC